MEKASLLVVLSLVVVACGGAATTTTTTEATTQPPPSSSTTTTAVAQPDDTSGGLTATPATGWSLTLIAEGTKPALALDSSGSPAVAFLEERLGEGFVAYAAASDGWAVDSFVEGYFYGPIGLAFDADDVPHVVWHDHQADQFDLALGDLTHGVGGTGGWTVVAAADDGHDGWDSTIAIGADGVVRAAGIDPAQFDGTDGVEYYELNDGAFVVEAIGSGPIVYEFNVGLAIDPDGTPVISYYDNNEQSLMFARRSSGGWQIVTVDAEADSGKFSDVGVDDEGRAHLSYLHQTGASTGMIRYAVEDGSGGWVIEDVAEISDLETGFTAARRITAIELDDAGTPHIAFSDRSGIWLASRGADGWSVEQVLSAGDLPLGQLVSMALDADGTPHITYFEVTDTDPLAGRVGYLTPG
jgi:hypothetical protein